MTLMLCWCKNKFKGVDLRRFEMKEKCLEKLSCLD